MRSRALFVVATIGALALALGAGAYAYSEQQAPPGLQAVIGVGPAMPAPGTPALFDCSGSSGNIVTCAWTVDGVPYLTFPWGMPIPWGTTWGPHTVGLTVTDQSSATDSTTQPFLVDTNPVADAKGPYTWHSFGPFMALGAVSDPDIGIGDSLASYSWTIDDVVVGGGAVTPQPVDGQDTVPASLFLTPVQLAGLTLGDHALALTVTDSLGQSSTSATTLTIAPPPGLGAVITITPEPDYALDRVVMLSCAASTGTVSACVWTLDGDQENQMVWSPPGLSNRWAEPWGVHTLDLTVYDNLGGQSSATLPLSVDRDPVATIYQGPYTYDLGQGGPLVLRGSGTDPDINDGDSVTYTWSIGNAVVATGSGDPGAITLSQQQVALLGLAAGSYPVTLLVTDSMGHTSLATDTLNVLAAPVPLHASISINPTQPTPGQQTSLDCSGSTGAVASCAWTLDSNPLGTSLPNPPLPWTAVWGTHEIGLTVTDSGTGSDTTSVPLTVDTSPTASAGGPYTWSGTGSVDLSGSTGDADLPLGDSLQYTWSIQGHVLGTGATAGGPLSLTLTEQQLALLALGLGPHGVSLLVTDSLGRSQLAMAFLTVTEPSLPRAKAEIWRQRNVNFGSAVDSISDGATNTGSRMWAGRVWNDDGSPGSLSVNGPTVSLDGYDHGQWTFTPDPGTGPWSAGPGPDLGPNGIYGLYVLDGWNPTTQQQVSQVQSTPVSTGFDASRSFDTTTIPTGGGDQVVTVTVTPQNPAWWLNLNVNPNNGPTGPATVVTDQVSTSPVTHGETSLPLNDSAQGVQWTIQNPVVGQTYVLTVRVHVPNAGDPFPYKAQVFVNSISYALESSVGASTTTTIHDPLLGGNWTFGSSGVANWRQEIADTAQVSFGGLAAPALAVSVDHPSVTVSAGTGFSENITVRALTGLTGMANIGLSGAPDTNGNPTPPMNGIHWNGPMQGANITGADPVSVTAPFRVESFVQPGDYTIYVQVCGLPGASCAFTPIAVTVTAAQPAATAGVLWSQSVNIGSSADAVSSGGSYPGQWSWQGTIGNNSPVLVPGPTISLDGYDAGRWAFTPDPGSPPFVAGPGADLGQGQQFRLSTLAGWDQATQQPTSSVQDRPTFTGYDASRSFDTTTIPVGGGDELVTVSITPRDPRYSGGSVNLNVNAGCCGAEGGTIDPASVSTSLLTHGEFGNAFSNPGGMGWNVNNVTLNQTYTLVVRVHVANTGSSAFTYKPAVNVGAWSNVALGNVDAATSTSITDVLLGGTWTFGASAPVDWMRQLTTQVNTNFSPISAPQLETTVSDPAVSVSAGATFSETATITPLNGFSGDVKLFLSGAPDEFGNPTPTPDGFWEQGQWPTPTVDGVVTAPLEIAIDSHTAPGDYTIYLVSGSMQGGAQVFTPIRVTVTPPGPIAHASVGAIVNLDALAADSIDASTPLDGMRGFDVSINNWDSVTVPGATISLPTGRTDFDPPVAYPLNVGPKDIVQNDQLSIDGLGGLPVTGMASGLAVARSVAGGDWSVPDGGRQTVTVTVTPQRSADTLSVDVSPAALSGPGQWGTIDTGSVTTDGVQPGHNSDLKAMSDRVDWWIDQPEAGLTYTLTVPIDVPVAGTYKPFVDVSLNNDAASGPQLDTSLSISDSELGGTATFQTSAPVLWFGDHYQSVDVVLDQVAPAAFTLGVDHPTATIAAGSTLTEQVTVTPGLAASGSVSFYLTGSPMGPPPDGIYPSGGWPSEFAFGPGPSTVPLAIQVDNSVAPGEYTFTMVADDGTGNQASVDVVLTVTLPPPHQLYAWLQQFTAATVGSATDSVTSTTPLDARMSWGPVIFNTGSTAEPSPKITLATSSRTFVPARTFPYSETAGSVAAGDAFGMGGLGGAMGPVTATSPQPGWTPNFDASRSDDPVAIAPGGGVQSVEVTITPQAAGSPQITVDTSSLAGATIDPDSVTGPANDPNLANDIWVDPGGTQVFWGMSSDATVGETYVLDLTINVPNNGSSTLRYKPDVRLGIASAPTDFGSAAGKTALITDPAIGTFNFFVNDAAATWTNRWLQVGTGVEFAPIATDIHFDVRLLPDKLGVRVGVPVQISVSALNGNGQPVTSFRGPVVISASAGVVTRLGSLTWSNGVGVGSISLDAPGPAVALTVSDPATGASGMTAPTTVIGPVSRFGVVVAPPPGGVRVGALTPVVVTAYDAWGNIAPDYRGPVNVNGSVPVTKVAALTWAAGVGTGSLLFGGGGSAVTLTVSDTPTGATGTSEPIVVAGPVASFRVAIGPVPGGIRIGTSIPISVSAIDVVGSVNADYRGPVVISASVGKVTRLGSLTWSNGVGIGSVALDTAGPDLTLIVTDSSGMATGTSAPFPVVGPVTRFGVRVLVPSGGIRVTAPAPVVVTAYDAWGNVNPDYRGPVAVSGTVPVVKAVAFSWSAGVGTGSVVFGDGGANVGVTVSDPISGATGTSQLVDVIGAVVQFRVQIGWIPGGIRVGAQVLITVTALDARGNVNPDYRGPVTITSSSGSIQRVGGLAWSGGVGKGMVFFAEPGIGISVTVSDVANSATGSNAAAFNVSP